MHKEIGSEFWNSKPTKQDQVFVLSGRTALEFIIRDILKEHIVSSVLLPSYCCHTMIEPFCRHGINVRFYDVFWEEGKGLSADVPDLRENEIFYYITYFGYEKLLGIPFDQIIEKAKIIIDDRTHSWLLDNQFKGADYSFASYRKWTGFSGIADASKYNGFFSDLPTQRNEIYCSMRKRAYDLKREYIENGIGDKQEFLTLFDEAENLLESDYVGYVSDLEALNQFVSLDKNRLRDTRCKNAILLIEEIKKIKGIQCMFPELSGKDVPLFVPIIVPSNRNELRAHLINNSIYCPVHWPISDYHAHISDRARILYNQELSLVCDQRYDEQDMLRIIQVISDFFKR